MRLAMFLETQRDPILEAAIAYARTIPTLAQVDEQAIRDDLPHLLRVIAADLRTPQSRTESIARSHGVALTSSSQTPAQTHGLLRARLGWTIEQLVAEFRALRSSILRLWAEAYPPGPEAIEDISRFNEAIDQAVAESVQFHAAETERWRQIFLGVVGHDLRGPLNTLALTVELMRRESSPAPSAHTAMLARGIKRLASLLDSLLEYSKASLGAGMALQRAQVDLGFACAEELELLRAAHPGAQIDYAVRGDTGGQYDASRVREALANLVTNAITHGDRSAPTAVSVEGDGSSVRISVENVGEIPAQEIEMLFTPLRQREAGPSQAGRTNLGLGLFITRQIAEAHGGEAMGTCTGRRVCFTIVLPKVAPRVPSAAQSEDSAGEGKG